MVDVLRENLSLAKQRSTALTDLGLSRKGYYLTTVHRASHTDDPTALGAILEAFSRLDVPVIFPAHPRTRKKFVEYGIKPAENVRVVEPLPYFDMLTLLSGARAVLTDSGGVQKEAYILKMPCVTLRENTEWVETIEDGWNVLVGTMPTGSLPRRRGPAARAGGIQPGSATGTRPRGSSRSSGSLNPEDKPTMHTIDVPDTRHVYGFQ
jgi:UDP-N-acetylglucosamine 2-epimerase